MLMTPEIIATTPFVLNLSRPTGGRLTRYMDIMSLHATEQDARDALNASPLRRFPAMIRQWPSRDGDPVRLVFKKAESRKMPGRVA